MAASTWLNHPEGKGCRRKDQYLFIVTFGNLDAEPQIDAAHGSPSGPGPRAEAAESSFVAHLAASPLGFGLTICQLLGYPPGRFMGRRGIDKDVSTRPSAEPPSVRCRDSPPLGAGGGG